jgi:3-methyladenine DNA glycosylase AlkD
VAADLVRFVQSELTALVDPDRAAQMASYMKTDMPFYGVMTPARAPIAREIRRRFPPVDETAYRVNVLALWRLPHREEKYLAIGYAWAFKKHVAFAQIGLYRQMIVEGAWWDLVDGIASPIVGKVLLDDRQRMRPVLEEWIEHEDLWLRRAALICQNGHKGFTDSTMLFDFCLRRAHEKEFFIRKAIGWALREYARTAPEAVRLFLAAHRQELSGLSYREASRHLREG